MLHTEQYRTIKHSLSQRKKNHSLSREFYCDDNIYQQDLSLIWHKKWIFVGHPMEINEIGDYLIAPIGNLSVIIYRDSSEQIKARLNHYNGNSFQDDMTGQLSEQLLTVAENLSHVHCEVASYYIYVSLAEQPDDISQFKDTIKEYIEPHKLSELKVAAQSSIIEDGNWKLVLENNRECYHCASNHPELVVTFPDTPTLIGSGNKGFADNITAFWKNCDEINLPCEFKIAEDYQYRITRMPLIKDFSSYTMHGYDAVKKRIPGLEDKYVGALLMFNYPNTWNHFLADQVLSFRVLPLDVNKTLVTTKWLVHKDAIEGEDYQLEELQHVWMETNSQDKHLVEQNQWGIKSPNYQSGPYSEVNEGGVIQFVDWYCSTLDKALSEKLHDNGESS